MRFRPAQHRALTGMQDAVCGSDRQFAALFALFNRLYAGEQLPSWERVPARRLRLLVAVLTALLTGPRVLPSAAVALWRAAGRLAARTRRGARRAHRRVRLAMAGAGGTAATPDHTRPGQPVRRGRGSRRAHS